MNKMEKTYEDKMRIDEHALDLEWLDQPNLVYEQNKEVAHAERVKDRAEDKLDFIKSELDYNVRTNPQEYGIDEGVKITEAVINGAVIGQEEYKEAKQELIDARFNWNDAKGAAKAFEHRKAALENMVALHGRGYFAGPKVPRNLYKEKEKREEQQKSVNSKVGKKLKRTKK